MSGAILNVVYGIPFCGKFGNKRFAISDDLEQYIEDEDGGFIRFYDAYGDRFLVVFGVLLACHDEGALLEVNELRLEPTPEEFGQFVSEWENLEEPMKIEVAKFGEPRVFMIWSNS